MHNKKIIIAGIICCCVLLSIGIIGCSNSDDSKTKKDNKVQVEATESQELNKELQEELAKAKTEEEKEKIKAKYEGKLSKDEKKSREDDKKNEPKKEESKKPATDAKPSVKPDSKPSQGGGTAVKPDTGKQEQSNPQSDNKPAPTPDTGKEPEQNNQTNEKPKKQVWVETKAAVPAWDEEVDDLDRPIYEEKRMYWIRLSGNHEEKIWFDNHDEWKAALPTAGSSGKTTEYVKVGYKKKIVHHPEIPAEGHWEYR